jgi:membrane-associated protein
MLIETVNMCDVDQLISLFHFVMHIGDHLGEYGTLAYAILSIIIFTETAFVVFPFLPGDTLLFAAGAFCATGQLSLVLLNILIISSAVLGNTVNFWIGKYLVDRIDITKAKWIDQTALEKTHLFFEKHGGKTIILARFVPLVRSFAPFVAGISHMDHRKFQTFNVIGAILWSGILTVCGYFFGNLPFIRDNLNQIVLIGALAAIVPTIIAGLWRFIQPLFNKKP